MPQDLIDILNTILEANGYGAEKKGTNLRVWKKAQQKLTIMTKPNGQGLILTLVRIRGKAEDPVFSCTYHYQPDEVAMVLLLMGLEVVVRMPSCKVRGMEELCDVMAKAG